VVAIHQPNFLPWLGFFDKLYRSDTFVILDAVQHPQAGGSWLNRTRLLEQGAAAWKKVPLRHAGLQTIRETEIADDQPWRARLMKSVRANYARASAFAEVMPLLNELMACPAVRLCDFNLQAIQTLRERLGLTRTRVVRQSELAVEGHSTDLLINLVRAVGGNVYLSGDGADGYLKGDAVADAGLQLEFQRFNHPEYPQRGVAGFVAGLSVVDALMQCGFERVAELLRTRADGEGTT
jgi:hypothetical protein